MTIKKSTPVLFVERVEPCIRFWTERMGFEKTIEVPAGNGLAFALLVKDGVELMYQTYASVAGEPEELRRRVNSGPTFLYIEVDRLADAQAAMAGVSQVKPEFETFYGSKEFIVRDPGGHFVTFAQQGATTQ